MKTPESFKILAVALIFSLPVVVSGQEPESNTPPCLQSTEVNQSSLSGDEIKNLAFMREEEKLARDVYLHFNERWSLMPFRNISKSEQAHMDALLYLIDRYEINDPAEGKDPGEFQNQELQKLYGELIARGNESPEEALAAAAWVEETDIIDLQKALDNLIENSDMQRVYSNLLRASKNHLKAFVRVLKLRGREYEPVLLDPEVFKTILES